MSTTEGTEDHDGTADDGQIGFADGEGIGRAGLPDNIRVFQDPRDGPDPRCADDDGAAADGEKDAEQDLGAPVDLEVDEHGDW